MDRNLAGPGLLESQYEDALFYELKLRNIPALSQVQIPVTYKNFKLREPMRLDTLVDNKVIKGKEMNYARSLISNISVKFNALFIIC